MPARMGSCQQHESVLRCFAFTGQGMDSHEIGFRNMASIWMLTDDVPVDDFVPSIVVPLIKSLGDRAIHANLEPTRNRIVQNEGTLVYALFPGGELAFIFTTGPTHNPISGTVDTSRYMMADIKGIPSGLGITEDDVSSAIRQFHTSLIEREIHGGRPRITDGNSFGGKLTIDSFPKPTRATRNQASAPQPQVTNPALASLSAETAPPQQARSVSHTGVTRSEATEPETAPRNEWPHRTASNTGIESKRGCYIATAVYGDYDHPQVRTLRRFRDETLRASWAGRRVIDVYYTFSPVMIRHFGDRVWFRSVARPFLDALATRLGACGVSDAAYTDPE